MSVNLLLEKEDAPVVWRGPVIAGVIQQFWSEVVWGDVDYMFVDMPPGTGDVPLTVFQSLPVDGIIIVSTPQDLVTMIVKKAFNMAKMMNIPVLGLVENMSYVLCPDCGREIKVFGGDAFNDLFMGMIVDNTRSRWGKFIPWLVIGTLVNSVIFVVLFTDFHLSGVGLCVFATAAYIMWGMTYTIMDIPYWSIIPNLTTNPEEREKVSVLPRIFASIGQSLIIAGFGVKIIKALSGGTTNQAGYHRFALIIAAVFILTIGITVINLPKGQDKSVPEQKVKFKDIFKIIGKNDQLRWAVTLIFLYNIGIQCIMGVATYYFKYVCGDADMMSSFMISASIAEVVGLIVFPKVAKMLSRKTSFLLACTLPAFGLIMLLLVGIFAPNNVVLTSISGVIVKLGTGLELGCATVFLADVVDYGEYKLGVRNEGVVFSLQTLIVKFTAALTALGIGAALGSTKYVPGQEQSFATVASISALMCIIPAICMLIAYVVYKKKYKLHDNMLKRIINTITARREGKIDMTEEINENGVTEPSHFSAKDTLKVGAK